MLKIYNDISMFSRYVRTERTLLFLESRVARDPYARYNECTMEIRDTSSLDQIAAQQSAFLAAYKEFGHDGAAVATAGITLSELQHWKEDEQFFLKYEEAFELFSGTLVREAIVRARDGWDEPIVHHGEVQYLKDPETGQVLLDDELKPIPATIRKKSEGLLKLALKANIEQYNPQSKVEMAGPEGEPLTNNITVEFIQPGDKQEASTDEQGKLEDENHG